MTDLAATLRVLNPAENVLGFYDGRTEGRRLHGPQPNWLDDGGYTLGTCSYAIIADREALVYDTHMSLDHARAIRRHLEAMGISRIRVVLSHHHLDHIAGNAVFRDCEIIANAATAAAMEADRGNAGTADPPVNPVVMPNSVFGTELDLVVGGIPVALRSYDIHSHDGLVLVLPEPNLLLAGDTLEDTVTYVTEPDRLAVHLDELGRMAGLAVDRILPNHGAEEIIAAGGYAPTLIDATRVYVERLLQCRGDPALAAMPLSAFAREELDRGWIRYYSGYDAVHRRNVEAILGV